MMAKLLFISGPMTGYPRRNHDAFHDAADKLRFHGYFVVSPAEFDTIFDSSASAKHRLCRVNIQVLVTHPLDGLATLPDGPEMSPEYPRSKGMHVDIFLALHVLQIPVKPVAQWLAEDPLKPVDVLSG